MLSIWNLISDITSYSPFVVHHSTTDLRAYPENLVPHRSLFCCSSNEMLNSIRQRESHKGTSIRQSGMLLTMHERELAQNVINWCSFLRRPSTRDSLANLHKPITTHYKHTLYKNYLAAKCKKIWMKRNFRKTLLLNILMSSISVQSSHMSKIHIYAEKIYRRLVLKLWQNYITPQHSQSSE